MKLLSINTHKHNDYYYDNFSYKALVCNKTLRKLVELPKNCKDLTFNIYDNYSHNRLKITKIKETTHGYYCCIDETSRSLTQKTYSLLRKLSHNNRQTLYVEVQYDRV